MPYETMKSTVRTDAARTRRRREDDYPNAPVAQRASRTYGRQQALKLADVRTDTEEPVFHSHSQDYDHLPVTNPGGRARRQDGDRKSVTNSGNVWHSSHRQVDSTTNEQEEERDPQSKPA